MVLTILVQQGKKYRKVAKGEINLYKKYFLAEKLSIEKFIHLELYKTQIDQFNSSSSIINTMNNIGKIYMKARLIDPLLEENKTVNHNKDFDAISLFTSNTHATAMSKLLRHNIKNMLSTKEKVSQNRTERLKSVVDKENEFLKNIRNKKTVRDEDLLEDVPEEGKYNILNNSCKS